MLKYSPVPSPSRERTVAKIQIYFFRSVGCGKLPTVPCHSYPKREYLLFKYRLQASCQESLILQGRSQNPAGSRSVYVDYAGRKCKRRLPCCDVTYHYEENLQWIGNKPLEITKSRLKPNILHWHKQWFLLWHFDRVVVFVEVYVVWSHQCQIAP